MKITTMRIFTICFLCLLSLIACSDEVQNYPVGSDFVENNVSIKVIDTFSIKASTFKLDSIVTSSTNRILVGSIDDNNLGRLTAQSYFQIYNSKFSISNDAVYDSIGFVLNYDTYYYGDTTKVQTYKIHRLLQTVQPDEGSNFYNTSKLELDPEPLGEITFTPRPNRGDSLYIPLSNELGEEIFNKIKEDDINTSDDFLQYFKGLTIVPEAASNSHILGFKFESSSAKGSSYMRLFFTEDEDDNNQNSNQNIDFFIPSSGKQFNAIKADFENSIFGGEVFEDVETTIPSTQTSNFVFSQAGTGISTRIAIPSLKSLNELPNKKTTLKSELRFSPFADNLIGGKSLKDSLSVYVIDHKNRIVSQLTDIDSNVSYAILNKENDEFSQNTFYSVDMSGFVEAVLNSTYDLNYAIMIQLPNNKKTVDHVVIKDFNEKNNRIKLIVNYLSY